MYSLLNDLILPSPMAFVEHEIAHQAGVELWIKRDDLIHPVLSGNKWRKILPLLVQALQCDAHTLVGVGGVYSNLLHALAYAGYRLNKKTIGWVRGHDSQLNTPTLVDCRDWGMQLRAVDRSSFQKWREIKRAGMMAPGEYFIPLGGTDSEHLEGMVSLTQEIYAQMPAPPHYICVPVGSGGTMAGILQAITSPVTVLGFSTFKQDFETALITDLLSTLPPTTKWEIVKTYPKPGFGRVDAMIRTFIRQFHTRTGIPLEAVYNGKMMYMLLERIQSGYFEKGTRIVALHTGGLQGSRSSNKN